MMDKQLRIFPQGDREIVMTRGFDAAKTLVWDAYTKPELLVRWLGAFGGWKLAVCEVDLRVGGAYRWTWQNANGKSMTARGEFKEIDAPERFVCTEQFDDAWYDGIMLNTVTFVERDGRTTMTSTLRYISTAVRDAVLKSPMESGVAKSYDLLEQLVTSA